MQKILQIVCFVCDGTGLQTDKEGNEVICPRCCGSGEALQYQDKKI